MKRIIYLIYMFVGSLYIVLGISCNQEMKESKLHLEGNQVMEIAELAQQSQASIDTVILTGIVKYYPYDKIGCFFVYPDMVEQNITESLGDKADGKLCFDPELGNGAPIDFSSLTKESDYPNPPVIDVLLLAKGYWKSENFQNKGEVMVFYTTSYEPLF